MVLRLVDLSLEVISSNPRYIELYGRFLTTDQKETLLQRLAKHDQFTPAYLPGIISQLFCQNLRKIFFFNNSQIDDNVLQQLANTHCKLKRICLHKCDKVTDVGVLSITKNQNELEWLELRKLPLLNGNGLCEIRSAFLHRLDLRGCSNLEGNAFEEIVQNNPNIGSLVLSRCNSLPSTVYRTIALGLRDQLKLLDVEGSEVFNDDSLEAISQYCVNLLGLHLSGCSGFTSRGLEKLFTSCTRLERLDLSYCNQLSATDTSFFLRLPESLSVLMLSGVQLKEAAIFTQGISRLKNIQNLEICGIELLKEDTLREILQQIGANLLHFNIGGFFRGSEVADKGLEAITKYCPKLEFLGMSIFSRMVHLKGFLPMLEEPARAQRIKTLCLSSLKSVSAGRWKSKGREGRYTLPPRPGRIIGNGRQGYRLPSGVVRFLPAVLTLFRFDQIDLHVLHSIVTQCSNLECLVLAGIDSVDDDLLVSLSINCLNLQHLNVKGCKMITDRGVCAVAARCPLRVLVVSGVARLTDRVVFTLINCCAYLKELYCAGCGLISPVAVRYLKDRCFNRLFVDHTIPGTASDLLMAKNLDTGEFVRADLIPAIPAIPVIMGSRDDVNQF